MNNNELIGKLISIKDPNEFDKLIIENSKLLSKMSHEDLSALNMTQILCRKYCKQLPYKKTDIIDIAEKGEIHKPCMMSQLYDSFNIAEFIFDKYRDAEDRKLL